MKKRVIAVLLILLLLLVPSVTGVFAEPNNEESAPAAETEAQAEAPDPAETEPPAEPSEDVPTETETPASEPDVSETEAPSEPAGPVTYTDFAPDLAPTDTEPGRESSHNVDDPSQVRYRYYWVVRVHSFGDASYSESKAYILNSDGSEIFTEERTNQTEALISQPAEPTRDFAEFHGWYTDPSCKDGSEFSFTEQTLIHGHLDLYAKWIEHQGTITIQRTGSDSGSQSFWYTITGTDGSKLQAAIPAGTDTVTISGARYGVTYTVTEQTAWSWRFLCRQNAQTVKLTDAEPSATLTFEGNQTLTKWLTALSQLTQTIG